MSEENNKPDELDRYPADIPEEFDGDMEEFDKWLTRHIKFEEVLGADFREQDHEVIRYTQDFNKATELMEDYVDAKDEFCHGHLNRIGCGIDHPVGRISKKMDFILRSAGKIDEEFDSEEKAKEEAPESSVMGLGRTKALAICKAIYNSYIELGEYYDKISE